MADLKFSCPQCSQHISCDEAWAGHQIECPACHSKLIVPQLQTSSAPPLPSVPPGEVSKATGPKLSAGATQVARSTVHAAAPVRKIVPRRPRSNNSLVGYAILLAVIAAVAGVGYFYGLPLLNKALEQAPNASPAAGNSTSEKSGSRGGPLGEVNEAMDVSESLDGGSATKSRPSTPTNNTARPRSAAPRR